MKTTRTDGYGEQRWGVAGTKVTACLKKAVLGIAVAGLCLVAVEATLAIVGVKPISLSEDPYISFGKGMPLFVESMATDGATVMRTSPSKLRWFNSQEFPKEKSSSTYRVFCVGGSTTYGRPYEDSTSFSGWLREFLAASDASKNYEVINAGGISYASYRIVSLMEELAEYEPDLFIVYCGHNEFLEDRTYEGLTRIPDAAFRVASVLSRTRLYSAMNSVLRHSPEDRSQLPSEVDTILEHTVGPESYTRDDNRRDWIVSHYELNLHLMVRIARKASARIIFVMPLSNLKDMSPFKSEHSPSLAGAAKERWHRSFEVGVGYLESGAAAEAVPYLEEASSIDPLHADTSYQLGRALFAVGRMTDAKRAFIRAIDNDICPLRILPTMEAALRRVAESQDVPLVDFKQMVADACVKDHGHDMPGNEYMYDHVHLNIATHRMLALELVNRLEDMGIMRSAVALDQQVVARVTERIEAGLDESAQGIALRNLGKVLNWAGKFREAEPLLLSALEKLGEDSDTLYTLGTAYLNRGNAVGGVEFLGRAVAADPGHAMARNNLGGLLMKLGRIDEAAAQFQAAVRLDPQMMEAHFNLGNIMCHRGAFSDAAVFYQRALQLDPGNTTVMNNLGNALVELGRFDEAIVVYSEVLERDPSNRSAMTNLATVKGIRRGEPATKRNI